MLKLATKFAPQPFAFECAERAGFHHAELYLDPTILAGWQQIVPMARHYPMEYVLHCPNRRELSEETLDHLVGLYRGLGCRALVIHAPHFERYSAGLLQREPGIRLAVENHKLTPEEFERWATDFPGLTLDVEHLWKFTLNDASCEELTNAVRSFLTRFGDKLRHVHMPGYVPGQREHRPMYCSREMVFDVLSLLDQFHFQGLVVSEVHEEHQNALELEMDVLLFRRWRERFDPMVRDGAAERA